MIRLIFACDGAAGRERLRECDQQKVILLDGTGVGLFRAATFAMENEGWTFFRFGARFIVRCPKCEALKVKRNAARTKRDTLREARKR